MNPQRTLFAIGLSLVAFGSSCMLAPHDREEVEGKSDPVHFSGYHYMADADVFIQARNFDTTQWETIGVVESAASTRAKFDGRSIYPWQADIRLDDAHWRDGYHGAMAEVRTLWNDRYADRQVVTRDQGAMVSVNEDWAVCSGTHDTVESFEAHCTAPRNPSAFVFTKDFCPSAPGLDVSRVSIDHSGPGTDFKYVVWLSNDDQSVSRIHVLGHEIDCRRSNNYSRKFVCESRYDRPPHNGGCSLQAWSENGGEVIVEGWESGQCHGTAFRRADVEPVSIGLCDPGPGPGPTPGNREICANNQTPNGWAVVDQFWDPTKCGNPSTRTNNVHEIANLSLVPVGTTLEICASESLPSGFSEVRTYLNRTVCGRPSIGSGPDNVRVIRRDI